MVGKCTKTFAFWLMDINNNPIPAGTTVSTANAYIYFTATAGGSPTAATLTLGGTPVVNTNHAGGTLISLLVDGGTSCTPASPAFPAGTVDIRITTPKGLVTDIGITVN